MYVCSGRERDILCVCLYRKAKHETPDVHEPHESNHERYAAFPRGPATDTGSGYIIASVREVRWGSTQRGRAYSRPEPGFLVTSTGEGGVSAQMHPSRKRRGGRCAFIREKGEERKNQSFPWGLNLRRHVTVVIVRFLDQLSHGRTPDFPFFPLLPYNATLGSYPSYRVLEIPRS